MALLSQPAPKSSSRTKRVPAPARSMGPTMALVGDAVELRLAGERVQALPEGALWIAEAKALIISDLHLEKGSSYALRGQMLPPYDTHAALTRVSTLAARLQPDIIISLGDSFHDRGGPARMAHEDRALLERLIASADWIWVEGNHDGRAAETLGGVARDVLHLGALVLRHEPTGAPGEIAGHLHPCARVSGRGRSVRRRCFATDGVRLVMPAFGPYTGGLNVCDQAFAPVFTERATALVIARTRVLPIQAARLLTD